MTDLEAARTQWLADRPQFDRFAAHIHGVLAQAVQRAGIWAEIDYRAKTLESLIKKLIRKPEHTYESLSDKAGVRIIVRYKHEIEPVLRIAAEVLERAEPENKADLLHANTFGYLSVHAEVKLRADDVLLADFPKEKFRAEMQVRTLAQHLWAEMAHNTVYKSESMMRPLNMQIQRRIYMLAGMVELADDEFNRIDNEVPTVPEFQMLKSLERSYYKLTVRPSDPELSLDVIRLLLPLYGDTPSAIAARLDRFFAENEELLHDVYSSAEELPDRSAFLFQPEALMIFDLLTRERLSVRESWIEHYPFKELERIANAFGITFA
jgi:ppGpp synthetase/RelA/SpoT-type nucleotidyltranferase